MTTTAVGLVQARRGVGGCGRARDWLATESGSLGSGRTAGYAVGEGRTSPRLGAIAGISNHRIPGGLLAHDLAPQTVGDTRLFPQGDPHSDRNSEATSGADKNAVFYQR